MQIILNGHSKKFGDQSSLEHLVKQFCKDTEHVIAELNGQVIKTADWNKQTLKDGDTIELVNFVGGG